MPDCAVVRTVKVSLLHELFMVLYLETTSTVYGLSTCTHLEVNYACRFRARRCSPALIRLVYKS